MKRTDAIELSILAAPGDLPFLEPTLRHLLSAFAGCDSVAEAVLVLDLGGPGADTAAGAELADLAERSVASGLLDRWTAVSWAPGDVAATMERWFARSGAPVRAGGGRALYQYPWSLDAARSRYVLHLDSDVLFHFAGPAWLDDALALLRSREDAAAVVPNSYVPRAARLVEWVGGRRWNRPWYPPGWNRGFDFTSRAFLVDRVRVEERLLPLEGARPGEQWERSVSRALERRGLYRYTCIDPAHYFLHPRRHNSFHARWVPDLARLVERGRYPYRRFGNPWDITTEGWKSLPWRIRIAAERLRR